MLLLVILFKVCYSNLNVVINTCSRLMHSCCVVSWFVYAWCFYLLRGRPPLWRGIVTVFLFPISSFYTSLRNEHSLLFNASYFNHLVVDETKERGICFCHGVLKLQLLRCIYYSVLISNRIYILHMRQNISRL